MGPQFIHGPRLKRSINPPWINQGNTVREKEIYSVGRRSCVTQTATSQWRRSDVAALLTEASDLAPRGSGNQNCGFQGACVAAVTPFVVWKAINFLPPPGRTLKSHLSTPSEGLGKSVLIVGLLRPLMPFHFYFSTWCHGGARNVREVILKTHLSSEAIVMLSSFND